MTRNRDTGDPPFRWALIREEDPRGGRVRFVVRKGRVEHREIRRVALTFHGEPYRWFQVGSEAFETEDAARQEAARRTVEQGG